MIQIEEALRETRARARKLDEELRELERLRRLLRVAGKVVRVDVYVDSGSSRGNVRLDPSLLGDTPGRIRVLVAKALADEARLLAARLGVEVEEPLVESPQDDGQ